MRVPKSKTLIIFIVVSILLFAAAAMADVAAARFVDADSDGKDSPGDEVLYGNSLVTLRFRFVDLSSGRGKADPKYNGYYLDSVKYRGESCFQHPDWRTESSLYPQIVTNDVVGMSAMAADRTMKDEPFLWMWNAREPARSIAPDVRWFPANQAMASYEWYTLYDKHEIRGDALFFTAKRKGRREEIAYTLNGAAIDIRYTITNTSSRASTIVGILTFPANRIIDTVFVQPGLKAARKITPTGFSDNYTFRVENTNGLAGSGMLFWSHGAEDSMLHMDGLFSWHSVRVKKGESATRNMTIAFKDQNIDAYYMEYLEKNDIRFDTVNWKDAERYLVSKVPLVAMPEGYIFHSYDYNPPGTLRDWHNEMTGRALIVQYLATGDSGWLEYTKKANRYYLDKMFFTDPQHICHGYFRDQGHSDKLHDCYPWSQPYNVESLIAEYAVTKDENLKRALLLNFEKMYDGPMYNPDGRRWYWSVQENGRKRDLGVFDAQEFGMDVMISAYEFTGDKKYLDRAAGIMKQEDRVLQNFGLLLEDRAGEPSVNTFAFAAKLLFKLYEYTGDEYWLDRAVRILNATIYSRVFMEPFGPEDAWLNGALARKDGDWMGQYGPPTTGTDSSVPSQSSFIPWVMEALVAGYNHTGNELYIRYMAQMLHHQLELNKRFAAATGGEYELCGHYNMYSGEFDRENDGLTVVSNLFLFPYVESFLRGVRSPHSSVVLLPGVDEKQFRAFHLSGITEKISIILSEGAKAASVNSYEIAGEAPIDVPAPSPVKYESAAGSLTFEAAPYRMYSIATK